MKKILLASLFLVSSFYFLVSPAHATGLSVTPQIQTVDLKSDPPQATFTYQNNTSVPIELDLSLSDFKSLDEIGTPELVNASSNYKYGLTSWVKLDTNSIVLDPGEKKDVTVQIEKERLAQGGHYAAVLAEIKQATSGKEIKLKGIFAALLLVRADSKYNREEARVADLNFQTNPFVFPESFSFRFQNTGNIDVTPYGLLVITDPFGREISKTVINENSLISLPETFRKYTVNLAQKSTVLPPGNYTATLLLHYGETNKKITFKSGFLYIGTETLAFIFVVIVVALLLIKLRRKTNS